MKFSEAVQAIEDGKHVVNSKGTEFWLEHDAQGKPVLMSAPAGYNKKVRHAVFWSGDLDPAVTWTVPEEPKQAAFDWESIEMTDEEAARRMVRASGDVECSICGKLYWKHPMEPRITDRESRPFLHRGCDGHLLKL